MPESIVSERFTEEWAVPLIGAGASGLAAYEISEEAPEIAAIVVALGGLWFLKTR